MERMQARAEPASLSNKAIPQAQRLQQPTWPGCLAQSEGHRARALHMAYRQGGVTMTALAQQAGLSVTHVSRLIATEEGEGVKSPIAGCARQGDG